ncbi:MULTISPECIES: AraC family transcriptional regulator [Pseudomonas]|jgi:AraC-like DNA-binding protein|uniref:Helix-turn-helix domain-containing protein n=2 Tax=Pseudomonas TaxID=286 RepID=A0A1T2YEU7_PSEFL|nr:MULTISPECIES: helix-turn-helix domain-containing protein [Pseudomonas]CRM92920.1 HTH-type transcriptional repressor of iron proteins A [Pseudomonas sp. 22 E 5]MCX9152495.1 helix-turn-helix domain-containing protein [Pseudomonas sp. TB1-B1]OPA90353.1 AraC family transcriptional regulator [Pseudomonas fluorescens]QXH65319.1 helix-turn-helix domain-containing protein [Pseudomonas asgharzadehiana]TFW40534.1 helix-turn-helix domain-containing protein [Pseudomonas fluorescens]
MAWLAADASFDPDHLAAPVIGIAALLGDHDSGLHQHQRGQLLFTREGCTRITLDNQLCLLPPTRAAWIPCGLPHRAVMQRTVDYRSVYLSPALARQLPSQVRVIEVSPLLRAVLEPIAMAAFDTDWSRGRYAHLLALCLSEICDAAEQPMLLPLPQDKRLAPLMSSLDTLPPSLQALEQQVGASAKTIGRIFQRETGLGYQQWRQQWRLMRVIELLATGRSISYCAFELGFTSDSALIAFFKHMTGTTPRGYFKAR